MSENPKKHKTRGVSGPDTRSPCNQQCKLSADTDICEGCYRTVSEILEWAMYTDKQKQEVLRRVSIRRSQ